MLSAALVRERADVAGLDPFTVLDNPAGDLDAELEELFEMTVLDRSTKTISSCTSIHCYTTVMADLGMI